MHTTLIFEHGIYMALKDKGIGRPTSDPHIHVFFSLFHNISIEDSTDNRVLPNVIEIKVKAGNLAKLMVRELRSI